MGLLNRFFESSENLAKDISVDNDAVLGMWNAYVESFEEKSEVISQLSGKNDLVNLNRIKELLDLELVDINEEEKTDEEVVRDLGTIEYLKRIKRIKNLKKCLGYAQTRYEHAYELLKSLYSVLKAELQIVLKLAESEGSIPLIEHLRSQQKLEQEIISQIEDMEKFPKLFLDLMKGERIIHELDVQKRKMLQAMSAALSGRLDASSCRKLTEAVLDSIDDRIHEELTEDMVPELNSEVSTDFINSKGFVNIVNESASKIKARKKIDAGTVGLFVSEFRREIAELRLDNKEISKP